MTSQYAKRGFLRLLLLVLSGCGKLVFVCFDAETANIYSKILLL
jgi:hypothetical protein